MGPLFTDPIALVIITNIINGNLGLVIPRRCCLHLAGLVKPLRALCGRSGYQNPLTETNYLAGLLNTIKRDHQITFLERKTGAAAFQSKRTELTSKRLTHYCLRLRP